MSSDYFNVIERQLVISYESPHPSHSGDGVSIKQPLISIESNGSGEFSSVNDDSDNGVPLVLKGVTFYYNCSSS